MKLKFIGWALALSRCMFTSANGGDTATFDDSTGKTSSSSTPQASSVTFDGDYMVRLEKPSGPGYEVLEDLQNSNHLQITERLESIHSARVRTNNSTCTELPVYNGVSSCEADTFDIHVLGWPDKVQEPSKYMRGDGRKLAEETPYGITMVKAADVPQGSTSIKVCVVDTGYGDGHPDLPTSGDHGVTGYSPYVNSDATQKWDLDGHGHGSHCAGTIGAIGGNDVGVTSVNPDPTKFSFHIGKGLSNSGSGTSAGVISAVNSCVEAGAKIISMSLGGGGYSQQYDEDYTEIFEGGVLIIAAAGNGGNAAYSYPASYNAVMSVAAVDQNEIKAGFSQYNDQVEIAAPGVSVKSTIPSDEYTSWSGTSMATPHVAGVAALVWSNFPDCNAFQIRRALVRSARQPASASTCNNNFGFGIVDAKAAYDYLTANGCGDASASLLKGGCEFDPENGFPPTPSPTPFNCNDDLFTLDLLTDNYGAETSWTLKDSSSQSIGSGSGYASNTAYTEKICLTTSGCYTFTISDSYSDGICCSYGSGSYTIKVNDVQVATGGEFGSSETKSVCTDTPSVTASPSASPTASPSASPTASPPSGPCSFGCDSLVAPWTGPAGSIHKCGMTGICDGCAECSSGQFWLVCGSKGRCSPEHKTAAPTEEHEVRCCSDVEKSGWEKKAQCNVWGESNLSGGQCYHAETFAQAQQICKDNDARLCTKEEIELQCATGSGCSHDSDHIWTSTPYTPVGQHKVSCSNSAKCGTTSILADDNARHEVSCCSDTEKPYWTKRIGCNVWSESQLGQSASSSGVCYHDETYDSAVRICAQHGARLCTEDEVLADCTRGTGCNHSWGGDRIWTSTSA
jgi:subtilisin family serine protease